MSNKKASLMIKGVYDQLDILKRKIEELDTENKELTRSNNRLRNFIDEWIDVEIRGAERTPTGEPQIGDKYIIEIGSHMTNEDGDLYLIKGFNSLVFDKNGLDKLEKMLDVIPHFHFS